MNSTEKYIVELLDAAMHDRKIDMPNDDSVNWNEIIDEAKEHKISALIYSAINNINSLSNIDENKLKRWKKKVFYSGVNQQKHISQVSEVLDGFNKENIPVIVLKGLVVRELYKNPALRTMSDADILVHEEDLERVSTLLIGMGFTKTKEQDDHGAHIVFYKPGNAVIEVHWTLINESFFSGNKEAFESNLWNDAVEVNVGSSKALSLSLEDLAVHLCVHMAVHLAYKGFGIRQLCDLVLLVEQQGKNINWSSFIYKTKECGVYKFTIAIFNLCNRLFNMEIPNEINEIKIIKDKYIDLLLEDIFASGVHGNKDKARVFASEFAFDQSEGAAQGKLSILKKFMKLLFPSIKEMDDKYNYAKRFIILAPIAWIHHLIEGVLNKDYSLNEKIKIATATISMSDKRNNLLRELEL